MSLRQINGLQRIPLLLLPLLLLSAVSLWYALVSYTPSALIYKAGTEKEGTEPLQDGAVPGKLTIILPTYRRVDALVKNPTLLSLARLDIVENLFILWNDVGAPVPDVVTNTIKALPHADKVKVLFPPRNSLNNRFIPWPDIRTECVFTVDDDFKIDEESFIQGFGWWNLNPFRLVGLYPRKLVNENGKFDYILVNHIGETYNAVLSGGGLFINVSYLKRYTEEMPAHLREFVDEIFNCEDILMQFTVPAPMHPPLLVGAQSSLGANAHMFTDDAVDKATGISRRSGHGEKRVRCVKKFHDEIGWPFVSITTYAKGAPPNYAKLVPS